MCVSVLPDGKVISGSSDRSLKVWDHVSGECQHTLTGHTGAIMCVSVLPGGKVISGSLDNSLKVWTS